MDLFICHKRIVKNTKFEKDKVNIVCFVAKNQHWAVLSLVTDLIVYIMATKVIN